MGRLTCGISDEFKFLPMGGINRLIASVIATLMIWLMRSEDAFRSPISDKKSLTKHWKLCQADR